MIYIPCLHLKIFLHLFIIVYSHAWVFMCEGQKAAWGSQFSVSTMWDGGFKQQPTLGKTLQKNSKEPAVGETEQSTGADLWKQI